MSVNGGMQIAWIFFMASRAWGVALRHLGAGGICLSRVRCVEHRWRWAGSCGRLSRELLRRVALHRRGFLRRCLSREVSAVVTRRRSSSGVGLALRGLVGVTGNILGERSCRCVAVGGVSVSDKPILARGWRGTVGLPWGSSQGLMAIVRT